MIQTQLTSDNYSFRKNGNEEQHKVNSQVLEKMKEADGYLRETSRDSTGEASLMAHRKISEGIDILSHRQKLVKLATVLNMDGKSYKNMKLILWPRTPTMKRKFIVLN